MLMAEGILVKVILLAEGFSLGEVLLLLVEEFLLMKLCVNRGGGAGVCGDYVREGFVHGGFEVSPVEVL